MNRFHWILLLLLSSTRLHNVISAIADVEDGVEEDEDPDNYIFGRLMRGNMPPVFTGPQCSRAPSAPVWIRHWTEIVLRTSPRT